MRATLDVDALHARVERVARLAARHPRIDAFEARADARRERQLGSLDGAVRAATATEAGGIGLQVYAGGGSAYVHTTDEDALPELVERAARLALANGGLDLRAHPPAHVTRRATYAPDARGDIFEASPSAILELLARAEAGARETQPKARIQAALGARTARTVYVDSAGSLVDTTTLLSTLRVSSVVHGARLGDGTARRSGERGLAEFEDRGGPEQLGRDASAWAEESSRAVSFPAGRYRVLCDNHLAGTLAHESFGHLAEHDLVASGWSTLRGRRGERLAARGVSVSDAPVVPRQDGVAVPIDDQGTPGRKTTMLDDGVLRGWMHTRDSAAAEGDDACGNGRALDSRFPPIVRMRNTFFEPGDASVDDALEALGDGVYLIGARGGAPYSDGSFMFTAVRGYLVHGGKLGEPVRPTAIHGNVLDFLQRVELVTRDFEVHSNFFGGCGKADQSFLHVGVGGPHVLVDGALAGGQGA